MLRYVFTILLLASVIHVQAKPLTLTILDEDGKPIPNAKFYCITLPKPKDWQNTRMTAQTDDQGQYIVPLDDTPLKRFSINVDTPGYTRFLANWDNPANDPIPDTYAIKLEKALTVGGSVLDPDGKPITGAKVSFFISFEQKQMRSWTDHFGYSCESTTNENGFWKYESVPADSLSTSRRIEITHKDFSFLQQEIQLSSLLPQADGTFSTTFRLEQGITVKGTVTDTSGKPIEGVTVIGRNINRGGTGKEDMVKTDVNGEYILKNWTPSREAFIGIWKAGMMAALESLPPFDKANPLSINFTMKPIGKPITIKIVDKNGKPIQGFYIAIERWKDQRMPSEHFLTETGNRPRTDADGRWTWKEAPDEEIIFDMFLSDQYMDVRNKAVTPRDEEYVFTSSDPLNISGNVTDAETGEAIPVFNVFFGRIYSNSNGEWSWNLDNGAGANGKYSINENYSYKASAGVKIEADGYVPAISRKIDYSEGRITVDFALKKLSADQVGIHGIVLQPDGKPANNATIAMATFQNSVDIETGGKVRSYSRRQPVLSGELGQFKFPYIDFEAESEGRYQPHPLREKVDFVLLALHDTGFKRITQQDWQAMDDKKSFTLELWGRIEGTVKVGTQPGKRLPIQCSVYFNEDGYGYSSEPHVWADYHATADELGKFVFDRVPPAFVNVGRTIRFGDTANGGMSTMSHGAGKRVLKPGETLTLTLGGVGRPVTGKLTTTKEFETTPDWRFAHIECLPAQEDIPPPDMEKVQELQEKMVPKGLMESMDPVKIQAWIKTEDGKKFQAVMEELMKDAKPVQERNAAKRFQRRVCAVAADGTFRLDDMFAGDWTLTVQLDAPREEGKPFSGARLGKLTHTFTVSAIPNDVSDEPQDLGSLEVEKLVLPKPIPAAGEVAPEFEIVKIEPLADDEKYEDKGEKLRLSDFKGKYVVLDFWAMWCGPCLAKVPELQKLYEKIKDDDRFTMIGISLDGTGSEERLGKFIVKREMPWQHGLAGDWEGDAVRTYGVRAIPAIMLIDTEGKVLLSNPDLAVLAEKVEELL